MHTVLVEAFEGFRSWRSIETTRATTRTQSLSVRENQSTRQNSKAVKKIKENENINLIIIIINK
jgi:hypothetical protein